MPRGRTQFRRVIAAANVAIGAVTLMLNVARVIELSRIEPYSASTPHPYLFSLVCAVAIAWSGCCILSGFLLWQGKLGGYWMSLLVGLYQLGFLILSALIGRLIHDESTVRSFAEAMRDYATVSSWRLSFSYSLLLLLLLTVFIRKSELDQRNAVNTVHEIRGTSQHPGFATIARWLGGANIFFGSLGILLTVVDLISAYFRRNALVNYGFSLGKSLFEATINVGLLSLLILAGILLLKLDRRGVSLSNLALILEVVYWFVSAGQPSLFIPPNLGLAPQALTLYPILALLLLNWSAKRMNRGDGWRLVGL
jgi:hypothetical protein